MMATLFTITDPRTKFCRAEMKANNGVWNPITQAWMFAAAEDAANALCALYQTTRPSMNQREALLEMAADGTGASAWDFDPATDAEWFERLDREKASALLAAGYAVRKLLGRHPLEDVCASLWRRRPPRGASPVAPRRPHRLVPRGIISEEDSWK